MLKQIELARILIRLARASKPTYYEVGPSYHQELDINDLGSAKIVGSGKYKQIMFTPYTNQPIVLIPLNKALELLEATTYEDIREIRY